MALTSFLTIPAAAQTTKADDPVADALLRDEIQQAESLLAKQSGSARNVAYKGEIEFRKGHFDQADSLYQEALKLDSKAARAHFGLGKLALARVKSKLAVQELMRAIELDPTEPLYRLYASESNWNNTCV
jgi:tetratricopeptide (TPR) repeat protein